MKRLLILAPALALALPAMAQDAPEAGYQALWCHLAFSTASTLIPPLPEADVEAARAAGTDATPDQLDLLAAADQIQQISDGIPILLEAADASYTAAGFTPEQFEAARAELEPSVTTQVSGSGDNAEFSFLECALLLPGAEGETTE
jgi:hypothetical protein